MEYPDEEGLVPLIPGEKELYEKMKRAEGGFSPRGKGKGGTEFGSTKKERMKSIREYVWEKTAYRLSLSNRSVGFIERWGSNDIDELIKWFNKWIKRPVDETNRVGMVRDKIYFWDINEYLKESEIGEIIRREKEGKDVYNESVEAWLGNVLNSIELDTIGENEKIKRRNAAYRKYNRLKKREFL